MFYTNYVIEMYSHFCVNMGKELGAILIMFSFLFIYLRVCIAASLINMSNADMSSLLALKSGFNSDILATNWSQQASLCTWIGVTCDRRHVRVTALDLSGMGLHGSIAPEIGNLSFLTYMNINDNSISGIIPREIGQLRRLRVLDMSSNHFTGNIPLSFGNLSHLQRLELSANQLTGELSSAILNISSLLTINVGENRMSGSIPNHICTQTGKLQRLGLYLNQFEGELLPAVTHCLSLKVLSIAGNKFTGNIPTEFWNLSAIQLADLGGNKFTGELSSTILNISSLLYFDVGRNQMSGTIPKQICSQSAKLRDLRLYSNQFEGQFLSAVIHCHSLKVLSIPGNKFTGNIPTEFWNLSAIQSVFLERNNFTGTIPPSIANLTNLARFMINENSFYGTIPREIGQVSSLTVLDVEANKLNGEVPQSIFNISSLQMLGLGLNNLSGYLPLSIDKGLPNIEAIYVPSNQFHGKIPSSISNLSKLTILELGYNSFIGHVPITLGNLPQLRTLSVFSNHFTNNLSLPEQDFLSSLTTCKYLEHIEVANNPISGVLPKSIGSANLSASLQRFHAQSCRIRSPLPNEIGNLTNLIDLDLGYNELIGAIPAALGSLRSLQALHMYTNKLQGSIPHAICNLGKLYSIDLGDNNLTGPPPRCLANLSMLREIYLPDNALNFTIPPTSWFHEHIQMIAISNNFLHGYIPVEIGNLKDLIVLDLSKNQLSGEIPSSISQLQKLIALSLSNNKLNGSILDFFADLKDLQFLDLSHNNLSGPIPTSLEKLANLNHFNVSFNELSGKIPDGGPFLNFTPEFFAGNKGLCGMPRFQVGACKTNKATSKKKLLKYILPVIALIVVAAIILIFVLRRRGKKFLPSSLFDLPLVVMPERISYYDILRATSNLDEQNLIGRGSFGSVYRANFSNALVATVKVFNLDVQGAFKSFDTECQILRSIRHRNLVKVITSCSNLDFKALVMAYMPNGNLERWLYSGDCSLNLFQRLGIMMDVASAVEYLHEGYTSPIVHCDLKPNNILLDEDMVAHVGDFGISKLLTQEQRMMQTRTLGTIGYIAPEYGSEGLVSTMVDVYSYGILLMEVFTRRRPTDDMFSGDLTMRRWVSESFPSSVMQIVDHELVINMDDPRSRAKGERCFISAMELALECTVDMAEKRPNIKDVVARINKIKSNLSNRRS